MKKILCILVFSLCIQNVFAEKYALIIAVGNYPKSTGWPSINSANDVPLIKQTLLNQNFLEKDIEVLLDNQATYKNIINAFNSLLKKARQGDIVVIHFSGHGQQIFDNNGDEIDGKDEALIPYDAWVKYTYNYKGENHLRDDELGEYIIKFRNKLKQKGQLLILLDSCHSGSSTRGGIARGSQSVFAPMGWSNKKSDNSKGSDMVDNSPTKLSKNAAPFVVISGAAANELNYEYKGKGSLSYAFSKAMANLGNNFSFNQLFAKIETEVNVISPRQNPTIEGDLNIVIFNNKFVKQQPYFKIKNILRENIIKIPAGKLQGLFDSTTVNILPSGTTKVNAKDIITKGKLINTKFNEATIKLDKPLVDLNEKKYWVFIDNPTYGAISADIYYHESLKNKSLRKKISSFLDEKKIGKVVKDSSLSDVTITSNEEIIKIFTTNGLNEIFEINKSEDLVLEQITQKIFEFAQGQYLKKIDLKNYKYEFEFKLLPIEYNAITEERGNYLEEDAYTNINGTFQVIPDKDAVVLQVTNKSSRPLYFSIIEINSKGEINPFFPNNDNSECALHTNDSKIPPNSSYKFDECIFTFDSPYEKLILKGFATPFPINLQPTINTRGKTNNITNPLENLLYSSHSNTRGASASKSNSKIDGFSTEFVYEIVKED